jgi:hypothetical protein
MMSLLTFPQVADLMTPACLGFCALVTVEGAWSVR